MAERRYRLVKKIAAGGMAQVWEAHSETFGCPVAIKRVLPHLRGDLSIRRMFLDEARVASVLEHPNIVRVVDFGVVDDWEVIVMELVDGPDCRQALTLGRALGQPMPELVALHIISELSKGLDYAHRLCDGKGQPLDIVHRDVNPPNIILGRDGSVKLSDFGIARAQIRQERTATGVVKGKEGFVAPEQASGQAMTSAVDVYLLGATLHDLLTGFPPLRSYRAMSARFQGGPLRLSPALSPKAAELVSWCMELAPQARPTACQVGESAEHLVSLGVRGLQPGQLVAEWIEPVLHAFERSGTLDDLLGSNLDETEPFGLESSLR